MWSIIGGTGFENFEEFQTIEALDRATPFGDCSSGFKKVQLGECEVLFIPRHGSHHEHLPSEVNYRANIFALKKYGASKIMSISAVGSLRESLKPGDMVVPHQYIDRTKSLRQNTFCGAGIIGHISLANPVSAELVGFLKPLAKKMSFDIHFDKTTITMEGPAFSTKAESHYYRQIGGDIIGMTAYPEYALAREAGLAFLPCSFVTDYDCWDDSRPHVTVQEVIKTMKANNKKAFQMALEMIPSSQDFLPDGCRKDGLQCGIFTPEERWTSDQKKWLSVLLK